MANSEEFKTISVKVVYINYYRTDETRCFKRKHFANII